MTTSDPRAWLTEAQERAEEYRPTMDLEVVHDWAGESVNDTIEAVAALTAVLKLHKPFVWDFGYGPLESCKGCADQGAGDHDYPCPTVREIEKHLTKEDDRG